MFGFAAVGGGADVEVGGWPGRRSDRMSSLGPWPGMTPLLSGMMLSSAVAPSWNRSSVVCPSGKTEMRG